MKLYLLDLPLADSLICIKVPKRGVFTLIMTLQLLIFHLSDYHSLEGLRQGPPRAHGKRPSDVKPGAISKGRDEWRHTAGGSCWLYANHVSFGATSRARLFLLGLRWKMAVHVWEVITRASERRKGHGSRHIMKVHYTSRAANIWGLAEVANCLPSCLSAIKASILFLLHSLSHIHPPWGEKGFGEFTVLKYVKWATVQIYCTLETPMKSMYVYINGRPICSLLLGGGNQARIFSRSQLLQMKWLQLTHHHCT